MTISVYIDEPNAHGFLIDGTRIDYEIRFEKKTRGAAGYDLHAAIGTARVIEPQSRIIVRTGIYIDMPVGFEAQVRPRSGLLRDHGVGPLVGTVDSDYRGEIKVILFNFGDQPYTVLPGDRIAQLVFGYAFPVPHDILRSHYAGEVELVKDKSRFTITERDDKGFGSSGR